MAASVVSTSSSSLIRCDRRREFETERQRRALSIHSPWSSAGCRIPRFPALSSSLNPAQFQPQRRFCILASLPPPPPPSPSPKTNFSSSAKLYVSGLSFRTTEESLRNAFQNFGQLVEVNLVMDRIANRPRGFAFLRYATEEESKKAIEGMHGKFLDGRVIFVEVAKPRSEIRQGQKQIPRQY